MNDMSCSVGDSVETFAKREWLVTVLDSTLVQIKHIHNAQKMKLSSATCGHISNMVGGTLYVAYLLADPPYEDDLLELSVQVGREAKNNEYLSENKLNELYQAVLLIRREAGRRREASRT